MKRDWRPEETAAAVELRQAGTTYAAIAARFDRSAHGVKRHLQYRAENPS